MKGKITTAIGIIIVILAAAAYILFEAYVKDSSNAAAVNVIVAAEDIKADTVVHSASEAASMFKVERIQADQAVKGAVTVASSDSADKSVFDRIADVFIPSAAAKDEVAQLSGLKLTRAYAANEQILSQYVSKDTEEYAPDERLYALTVVSSAQPMTTEFEKGDYLDLWIIKDGAKDSDPKTAEKIYGPLKIYKMKNSDGTEITEKGTPASTIFFKLNNEEIAYIASKTEGNSENFFVKYGTAPSDETISGALQDSKAADAAKGTSDSAAVQSSDTAAASADDSSAVSSSAAQSDAASSSVSAE